MNRNNDKIFLAKAIKVALEGMEKGGGPFGAVIVNNGEIIAEAYNQVVVLNDPTAHAEILAIRQASARLKTHDLKDCTIYASCEPCPMCFGAIYWSGITRVFYALDRNDAAKAGFNDKHIYEEMVVDPTKRRISFIRLDHENGREVFRTWNSLENKIPY